ncbi:hypothetical protein SFK1770_3589 [Shigella flexneri K-1770]|nr:hypothetical protein SFK1770_3589 [Shigella flexneri K-1770]CSE45083.1 Uncharacterised protein [Shigella sonnei]
MFWINNIFCKKFMFIKKSGQKDVFIIICYTNRYLFFEQYKGLIFIVKIKLCTCYFIKFII